MEKEKEEKINIEQAGSDSALKCCPGCNSEMVWRIQRTEAEKITCYLSKGQYAGKKYLCRSCGHHILAHRDTIQYMPLLTDADTREEVLDFIACEKCHTQGLQLKAAENRTDDAPQGDKTSRIVCGACGNEMLINKYEYDAADSSGF